MILRLDAPDLTFLLNKVGMIPDDYFVVRSWRPSNSESGIKIEAIKTHKSEGGKR